MVMQNMCCINTIILRGRWMLESDWLTNVLTCAIIFRETHGEHSSRQLSWPHYMTISLHQTISVISKVLQEQYNQNPQDTGQIHKYSKQNNKIDRSCPYFCYKITFYYVWKTHSLLALGLSLTDTHIVCTHINISAIVVSYSDNFISNSLRT